MPQRTAQCPRLFSASPDREAAPPWTIRKLPVLEAVSAYQEQRQLPFTPPGHKQGRGADPRVRAVLGDALFRADTLAVAGMDDRTASQGVLEQAEELMADAVGADHTFSRRGRRVPLERGPIGLRSRRMAMCRSGSHWGSFFVSRVDTEVDARLDALGTPEAQALKGKAAIANARLAHQAYEEMTAGARPQRPLWASTGVKNPAYPDTMYVSELVIAGR